MTDIKTEVKHWCDDLDKEVTIREYLKALLEALWDEGEGFNSKRPFGNSGWEWWLYEALVKEGKVDGHVEEDGFVSDVDIKVANKIIFDIIEGM